jgi:hypothetical protein
MISKALDKGKWFLRFFEVFYIHESVFEDKRNKKKDAPVP